MALRLVEGFDHMIASLVTTKGWGLNPASMTPGRFGGQAARTTVGTVNAKSLPAPLTTLFTGWAVRLASLVNGADFITLRAGATATVRLSTNLTNKLQVRNSGGTVIATGTTGILTNTWYYIELGPVIAGASGSIEVRLNGVSGEIPAATGNFGSTGIDNVGFGTTNTGNNADFDDIYVCDNTGAMNNGFLGDVRVATIMPNADGAHTAWTPTGGGSHFSQVDEITGTFPDGDTTYVSDSTPGDIDSYAFDDIDGGATVYGIQKAAYVRKDDAAVRQVAFVTRQSAVDHVGATFTLGATYAFITEIDEQDPTPANWTPTTINGDEWGMKEIA